MVPTSQLTNNELYHISLYACCNLLDSGTQRGATAADAKSDDAECCCGWEAEGEIGA